ncbi:hypothetical protein C2G38_2027562 [Gigaspora rosea]|uniref:Uncharacterized protein n=1 Tax=Gigaspora rosea TaxID=44941 RepID=A0A397W4N3_9GLOM|nr:hypothetical protein C2G38_2027562 [Gigaspora rosea]CAG8600824.1 19924_t:CDS:2 [Gigaspora rosea]
MEKQLLKEENKNQRKRRKLEVNEYAIPVVSDGVHVINFNRTKADIEKKSILIESDLKVPGQDEAMMKKMCNEKFKDGCEPNELVKGALKVLMEDDMLNNVVIERRKTKIDENNIPGGRAEKHYDETTVDEKESKEDFDLARRFRYDGVGLEMGVVERINSVDRERGIDKNLIDEIGGNDNRLNDGNVEIRETAIDECDIPDLEAEKGNNGDKAPNGKTKIDSIRTKNIKGTRDERSCRDELFACDLESAMKTEEDRKGRLYIRNKADKLGYNRVKGEGIEAKNDDIDEVTKHVENDHVDDK